MMLFPYVPEESSAPLPASVKRRLIEIEGDWTSWKMPLVVEPVYCSVPPLKTRLAALVAALVPSPLPMLLAVPALARTLAASVPALTVVTPL